MDNHRHKYKRLLAAALIFTLAICSAGWLSAMAAAYVTTTTVASLNCAPVAENLSIETYRGVAVTGTFRSVDPEGDSVSYSIAMQPRKGQVAVDGSSFSYTPGEGKKGKDSFSYVAIDCAGNISGKAEVTVNIKKQSTKVVYSDMSGSDAWYAATELAERGIFVGERVGDSYLFSPDLPVTRGEFLAMCIDLTGGELVGEIARTGFADDADIPVWQKPYVTTAVMLDIVNGKVNEDGKIIFAAGDNISFAEATVMLNNALAITDVSYEDLPETCPAWASQAVANLSSCRIITDSGRSSSAASVTRGDAAKLLLGALELSDSRSQGGSLLSWAR